MDVAGINRIRPVEQVGVKRGPGDVAPLFGVDEAARLDEDSYREGSSGQERGMEEDAERIAEIPQESSLDPEPDVKSILDILA